MGNGSPSLPISFFMQKTLIIGYGNPDRQDDGVAWHVLIAVARSLEMPVPSSSDEGFDSLETNPAFLFVLQLTPELSETLTGFERVCFIDAHTGAIPNDVNVEYLVPQYHSSPFTHHMTAQSLIELSKTIYNHQCEALIVSVRGYEFGFSHSLSSQTSQLAEEATGKIITWLSQQSSDD